MKLEDNNSGCKKRCCQKNCNAIKMNVTKIFLDFCCKMIFIIIICKDK